MLLNKYSIFFLLLLAADLAFIAAGNHTVVFILKFLLMPVLITGLLQAKKHRKEKNWRLILAGLVMAWAGDVLLLFSPGRAIFFILGLVCFLCTHLAYIVYFSRYHTGLISFIKSNAIVSAAAILYALLFLLFLWPHLGALLLPVIAYTVVITCMVLQSFAARKTIGSPVATLFIAGAVLFIISDSLLATAKFYHSFFMADLLIILTYGVAQLLIVNAAIKNGDGGSW